MGDGERRCACSVCDSGPTAHGHDLSTLGRVQEPTAGLHTPARQKGNASLWPRPNSAAHYQGASYRTTDVLQMQAACRAPTGRRSSASACTETRMGQLVPRETTARIWTTATTAMWPQGARPRSRMKYRHRPGRFTGDGKSVRCVAFVETDLSCTAGLLAHNPCPRLLMVDSSPAATQPRAIAISLSMSNHHVSLLQGCEAANGEDSISHTGETDREQIWSWPTRYRAMLKDR